MKPASGLRPVPTQWPAGVSRQTAKSPSFFPEASASCTHCGLGPRPTHVLPASSRNRTGFAPFTAFVLAPGGLPIFGPRPRSAAVGASLWRWLALVANTATSDLGQPPGNSRQLRAGRKSRSLVEESTPPKVGVSQVNNETYLRDLVTRC